MMNTDRLANLLGAFTLSLNDLIGSSIEAETGLKGTGLFAIVILNQTPGITIDELAQILSLAHSSTVRLIDRLVEDGYVIRSSGEDKRQVRLELTKVGYKSNATVLAIRQKSIKQIISVLDSATQRTVEKACEQLLTRLTPDANSACRNCRLCDEDACQLKHCPVEKQYQDMVTRS